jgi:CBS domain-containing protein
MLGRIKEPTAMTNLDENAVRTLVHRPAVDVLPGATVRSVAQTLVSESVGIAVVRGRGRPGPGTHAAGMVSERDIVEWLAGGSDPDHAHAEDLMTAELASVRPDESIRTAALRMLDNDVRHLPVVDGDTVIGVISMRDALHALLDGESEARAR